jgi:hypothetical protein
MAEESVMEQATTATAGAAIVSPWWLPVLHDALAGWLLPIMGITWIGMQMYYKVKKERKSNGS